MIIRNRTTSKARRAVKTTGRGATPAKTTYGTSPERATEYSATPLGFVFLVSYSRGCTPACNLWPLQGLGGTIADSHTNFIFVWQVVR